MKVVTAFVVAIVALAVSCGQKDPTFRLAPPVIVLQGEIAVTSSVPGAAISLDGVATGRVTPDTLRNVGVGDHEVAVYLAGYYGATSAVAVLADAVRSVHFDLQTIPTTGAIAVTAPYPADILVDGRSTGLTAPATLDSIEPGNRTVTLSLRGFRPQPGSSVVSVIAGETAPVAFDLVAPKKILAEDFSNYACLPCPPADAALQNVVRSEAGRVVSLNPHLNWPSQADPFFQFNRVANCARANSYADEVLTMPTIRVDGLLVEDETPDEASIGARVQQRSTPTGPLALGVQGALEAGGKYLVTVDVWGVTPGLPTQLRLYTCIVERSIDLSPPGPNGQSHFVNVLREILPAAQGSCPSPTSLGGRDISVGLGDHLTFQDTWIIPAGNVNTGQLGVIAFVSDPSSKLVLQTGTSFDP